MRKHILFNILCVLTLALAGVAHEKAAPAKGAPAAAAPEKGNFTDSRDGKIYKTVKIGTQWVMSENLAYEPKEGGFWAYGNDQANAKRYGYLYTRETAMRIAPPGWHIPSREEWLTLIHSLGGKWQVYRYLGGTMEKIYKQVIAGGSSGFEALFGGYGRGIGVADRMQFIQLGDYAFFWSASFETDGLPICFRVDRKPGGIRHGIFDSREGIAGTTRCFSDGAFSVRLFRD